MSDLYELCVGGQRVWKTWHATGQLGFLPGVWDSEEVFAGDIREYDVVALDVPTTGMWRLQIKEIICKTLRSGAKLYTFIGTEKREVVNWEGDYE